MLEDNLSTCHYSEFTEGKRVLLCGIYPLYTMGIQGIQRLPSPHGPVGLCFLSYLMLPLCVCVMGSAPV